MKTIVITNQKTLKEFVSKNRENITNINGVQCSKYYPMIEVTNRNANYYNVDSQESKFFYPPFKIELNS